MHASPDAAPAPSADDERHATNLELFLDLVFVFAVTQITALVAHDLTPAGIARGALVAGLVWWMWSQFSWAGAAVDLQRHAVTRGLVLATVPATLLLAIAIPTAYGDGGAWFGGAYLAVHWLVLAMQGAEAMGSAATRRAFIAYTSVASIAPVAVLVGGLLDGDARTIAWSAALGLDVIAALRGAAGEWTINPVHFAERHALFVIIALGEALVAIGATAADVGLDRTAVAGIAAAAGGACVLWWGYFAFVPNLGEHALCSATGARRGVLARDLMTLGHFPIVAGVIGYAVVAKHVVRHPDAALGATDRWLLAGAVALVLGAEAHIQYRVGGRPGLERLVAVAAIAAGAALGGGAPAAALVGGAVVVLGAASAVTWRRFRASELAHVSPNR